MASTFDNDLRLEEMATGENAGSWGTKTNTNLELIADAFGYGTFTIANADTTLTMPDGSDTDNALRSLYLKISSSADLTTTRTLTLAPNTVSKLWYIENNTSGGQTITISQGSGANVNILNGQAKLVATDGAGAGAAVIDATQDLAIPDLFIDDDLSLQSDGAIINFGEDADVNLTHVADTGLRLNDAMALQFRDSALSISSSADGQLDIDADTEIEITAPTVDINASTEVNISGDLKVDTDTLYVDSTNNRVGIGEASPDVPLHIKSADNVLAKLESTDATVTLDLIDDTSTGRIHQQASELRISSDPSNTVSDSSVSFYVDGSEAARFDNGQRLLVGHNSSIQIGAQESIVQVIGSGAGASSYSAVRYTNTANASKLTLGKSRATTLGGNTIVQDGDTVGIIDFAADDGTDLASQAASINAEIDGTPDTDDTPGRLVFSTTVAGASSPTERMRITNGGFVGIGGARDADTALHIYTSANAITPLIKLQANVSTNDSSEGASIDFVTSGDNSAVGSRIIGTRAASGANMDLRFHTARDDFAMLIDTSQRVLIGLTSARTEFFDSGVAPLLQVQDTGSNAAIGIIRTDTSADGPSLLFGRSHGTGYGIVNNGDRLGRIPFQGADGVDFEQSASIDAYVDGTPGVQDMPGRMVFSVTPDGANATVEVLRISSDRTTKISTGQNMGGLTTFPSYSGEGAYLKGYVNGGGAGPYPRYLDIAALGDSSWGGVIRFLGNKDATATAVENARIDRDGHFKIGTVSGAGKLTVSNTQTAVDNLELAAFSGSDVNQRLTINNFFCGSDEDRVGLLFENQGTGNMRVWMGDDLKLYSKSGNPTADNDGNYFVQVNDSGNIAMPSGKGIDFSATGNGSGTVSSEVFDDYEEGTWTPAPTFGGGNTGMTFAADGGTQGQYTKIGNQVIAHFSINFSNKGSSTGTLNITGLPYNPTNTYYNEQGGFMSYYFSMSGIVGTLHPYVSNGPNLTLRDMDSATSGSNNTNNLNEGNFNNNARFWGTVIYRTS